MQEEGIIKKINGDIATVAFVKKGGCGGGCSSCKSGCPKDTILVDLKNTEQANIGERVLVSMDNKVFSNMTFWAYAFPTIVTVIALVICLYIFNKLNLANSEVYSVLLALVAMVISYVLSSKLNKKQDKYSFKMIKKFN
ncbi:SoxR reducing system RseC family protein [Clostridium sp.]|uniref:SoxR reducing system RseC family protein n=2 Tax=Clostridium sp. TaxID=1506 RepID=UPI00346481E2